MRGAKIAISCRSPFGGEVHRWRDQQRAYTHFLGGGDAELASNNNTRDSSHDTIRGEGVGA